MHFEPGSTLPVTIDISIHVVVWLTFDPTLRASALVVFSTFIGERRERFGEGAEPAGDGRGICFDDVTAMASWNTNHCSSFSSVSLPVDVVCVRA